MKKKKKKKYNRLYNIDTIILYNLTDNNFYFPVHTIVFVTKTRLKTIIITINSISERASR